MRLIFYRLDLFVVVIAYRVCPTISYPGRRKVNLERTLAGERSKANTSPLKIYIKRKVLVKLEKDKRKAP